MVGCGSERGVYFHVLKSAIESDLDETIKSIERKHVALHSYSNNHAHIKKIRKVIPQGGRGGGYFLLYSVRDISPSEAALEDISPREDIPQCGVHTQC